ncbi:hypothetical protein EMIHUDRAFT_445914 [Emiliania huxleyi CCMP1516]|uniref:Glycoside hydrolase family 5 domain-containing protein n=2 Tax=Emiliania huxleyi TaxID=2903 RepID=A0A0D3IP71_EMIH1|nr:hypothetical protein EMIHUDRAFT_445914 [Emiliania huxleyi CCMP1516]EOD13056.1 hypothetical protein EMIHUDRAFT_445914 [Emiliania huxleyi CCMP1516]|eukprot:XP_005765485.1 hypothetical protein EMIHUDRAFT_445914 [Emiliania huxleyi CCMP1516]
MLSLLSASLALAGTVGRDGRLEQPPPSVGRELRELKDNPYVCEEGVETAKEEWKVFGTNLGGWLVLEPWITPSLFYQFLSVDRKFGKEAPAHTGMDTYTFCAALGPKEGNKQLRRHWASWVREEDVRAIAQSGATVVRIPVGDWMYVPYEPYIGCTDGSLEELERALALLRKYGLRALLDVHAMQGSQNGFDNSGQALRVKWTQVSAQDPEAVTTFEHWPQRAADWLAPYDNAKGAYPPEMNKTAYDRSLDVIRKLAERHRGDATVWGVEPVNEPWQMYPTEWIKQFYWDAYHITREAAKDWKFVMHDSFRGYPAEWWGFMKGCPNKAMDSHIYQAWANPMIAKGFFDAACGMAGGLRTMEEQLDMPMIVGEWSLATDNCAMWLNGLNDNLPGYPKVSCAMVPCPEPYMGEQPGAPPDAEAPLQGPYGTGVSGPMFGKCPVGMPWGTQENETMSRLANRYFKSFSAGHGWFFWNFRTELEPRWSYLEAWRLGWFQKNVSDYTSDAVQGACDEEPPAAVAKPIVSVEAVFDAATAETPLGDVRLEGAAAPVAAAVCVAAMLAATTLAFRTWRLHAAPPEPDEYQELAGHTKG